MNAGTGEIRTTVQKSVVCVGDVMHRKNPGKNLCSCISSSQRRFLVTSDSAAMGSVAEIMKEGLF